MDNPEQQGVHLSPHFFCLSDPDHLSPHIGVRGNFTKQVCAHYGVLNTRVMGCPSVFTNGDRSLGEKLAQVWLRPVERLAIHASCIKAHVRAAERYLFSLLETIPGSSYILQRPVELMKIVHGDAMPDSAKGYLKKLNAFLAPDYSFDRFCDAVRRSGELPFSIDSWRFGLRRFSHSLGTRIHGAMLSLSAELPTVCITHDARTRELCSALRVPNIDCSRIAAGMSINEIFDRARLPDDFEANRAFLAREYAALIEASKLSVAKAFEVSFL